MPDPATPRASLVVPGYPSGRELLVHDQRDQHVSRTLREQGTWEPFETELLRRGLEPGARFLDVGANIGYFTVLAAHWAGAAGRVYAFEPEPGNVEVLRANVALHAVADRVVVSPCALGATQGRAQLYLDAENFGDHQLFEDRGTGVTEVEVVEGAAWFVGRENGLDFVKIDVQGAEHDVVLGLMPILRASGPGLHLLLELTPRSLRAAGTRGADLIETLAALDLPFHIVDHIEHRLAPTRAADLQTWCNNLDAYPEDAGFMNILLGAAL